MSRRLLVLLLLVLGAGAALHAQGASLPSVTVDFGKTPQGPALSSTLQAVLLLTVLTIAPTILLTTTCFTRIIIVLGFVRQGMGTAQFLCVGCLAVLVMGAAKGGFAGVGILSVPLMIYACGGDSLLANGIILPLLLACDYVTLIIWWRKWDARVVLLLLPGMVLGIALATVTLKLFERIGQTQASRDVTNAALTLAIGLLAVGFTLLWAIRLARGKLAPFRPNLWHGLAFGSAAGFTSTLANAAGPISTMYFLPQQMPKGRFVASTVLYFWIGNHLKLPTYIGLHLMTADSLKAVALFFPAVVVGSLLGVYLHNRVNEKWFSTIIYSLLAVMGAHLTVTSTIKLGRLYNLWG